MPLMPSMPSMLRSMAFEPREPIMPSTQSLRPPTAEDSAATPLASAGQTIALAILPGALGYPFVICASFFAANPGIRIFQVPPLLAKQFPGAYSPILSLVTADWKNSFTSYLCGKFFLLPTFKLTYNKLSKYGYGEYSSVFIAAQATAVSQAAVEMGRRKSFNAMFMRTIPFSDLLAARTAYFSIANLGACLGFHIGTKENINNLAVPGVIGISQVVNSLWEPIVNTVVLSGRRPSLNEILRIAANCGPNTFVCRCAKMTVELYAAVWVAKLFQGKTAKPEVSVYAGPTTRSPTIFFDNQASCQEVSIESKFVKLKCFDQPMIAGKP